MPQIHPADVCSPSDPDDAVGADEFRLLPNPKIANAEKKPDRLDYHELPEKYRVCLSAFDDNNDGMIETIELINAARMLRHSKRTARRLYQVLFTLLFVICALVGAIAGLTWYIVDSNKDMEASDIGLLLNRHTKLPVATRGTDLVTHNYPSLEYMLELSFDDLDSLEAISIAVANATTTTSTKLYRIAGAEKLVAADGPMVILSASSGEEIHVSAHNTTFKERDGSDAFFMERDGTIVLSPTQQQYSCAGPSPISVDSCYQQAGSSYQYGAIVAGATGTSSARFRSFVHTQAASFNPSTKTLFDPAKVYAKTTEVCEAFYDPFTQKFSRYVTSGATTYTQSTYSSVDALKGGSYPLRAPDSTSEICDAITSFRIKKYDENTCAALGFYSSVGVPGFKTFKNYLLDVFYQPTDVPPILAECVSPTVNGVIDADQCETGWLALKNYPRWRPWNWAAQQDGVLGNVYVVSARTNHGTGYASTTNSTLVPSLLSRDMQMSRHCILTETSMGFPDNWREYPGHYVNTAPGSNNQVQKWWRAPLIAYRDDDNELICHCLRYNFVGAPQWV